MMETQKVYEIMAFINLILSGNITLDILSEEFSYSKFHLHREFKANTFKAVSKRIVQNNSQDYIHKNNLK